MEKLWLNKKAEQNWKRESSDLIFHPKYLILIKVKSTLNWVFSRCVIKRLDKLDVTSKVYTFMQIFIIKQPQNIRQLECTNYMENIFSTERNLFQWISDQLVAQNKDLCLHMDKYMSCGYTRDPLSRNNNKNPTLYEADFTTFTELRLRCFSCVITQQVETRNNMFYSTNMKHMSLLHLEWRFQMNWNTCEISPNDYIVSLSDILDIMLWNSL